MALQPFKCNEALISVLGDCKTQKKVYDNLNNLATGKTTLAPNSVFDTIGKFDITGIPIIPTKQQEDKIIAQVNKDVAEKSEVVLDAFEKDDKKKKIYIYGGIAVLVIGVIMYEVVKRK